LWYVLKVFHSYLVEATVEFAELTTLIGDNRAGKKIALIVPIKLFGADASDFIIKARFII
jgi:ABC-type enterochelin transport system ATPase subunit